MIKTLGVEKVLWAKAGEGIAASGVIPTEEEFFKDHFPGFPILPGVLSLEMFRITADLYLRQVGFEQRRFRITKIRGVKFSHYLKPGETWESHLSLIAQKETEFVWSAKMTHEGTIAVSARLTVEIEKIPTRFTLVTL